jgi:hypothetical protein
MKLTDEYDCDTYLAACTAVAQAEFGLQVPETKCSRGS